MSVRLNDEPERLFIRSSPRLQWFLGVLVAAVGGLVLLAAVGVLGDGKTYTIASRTGAGLLGGLVCTIGAWPLSERTRRCRRRRCSPFYRGRVRLVRIYAGRLGKCFCCIPKRTTGIPR